MSQSFTSMDAGTLSISVSYDEQYQFEKLYDLLRDMDFPLTNKQHSVFEKIKDATDAGVPVYPEPEGCPSY
ncbi:hypothetical protein PRQG_00015 [Prochlorococcus phage P-GSP1]|uniref:Uncharacterized protein n=1 Tax=Prochlorococcus phage P-GSP1 TaxID=382262 RepID=M1U3J1_9CAUD|nr:hypothetical protein PRQG_00015 [Prochlorococcus phage P-GSP1]AGG54618.1 hypothetical protein PRQG_00015 [Prochlorococcus phage P-GSP1]